MKSLRVAKLHRDAKLPTRKNLTDAGIDFYALDSQVILGNSYAIVRTGVTVEIPDGYMLLIKPKGRSNHLVGAGVGDAGYEPGEILIKIFNVLGEELLIHRLDPIAQGVLVPIVTPELIEVDVADFSKKSERSGTGGIMTQMSSFELIED